MKLIIRADDIGYSEAVNYGIEKSVKEGLVSSAGLMPNMPAAAHGLKLLEGTGVCLGQHTNICLGKPCADPALIPSLLGENGNFKSSKMYREAWKNGEEFTVLSEMVIEVEAQYKKFKELTGQEPSYFEGHAVSSNHLFEALAIVAEKYGLPLQTFNFEKGTGTFCGKPLNTLPMKSLSPDYDPEETLKKGLLEHGSEDVPNLFVGHPGYVDDFIMKNSSLNINRTREVAMFCDPAVKEWLKEQNIELVTYDDVR
ncbi:MAG: ChbG/HpnK family deacetylase [Erysipelotrichaceae bacterium]|nr:ChbG/HpnK family deacetylase [Erysipelotrichaceae bacterium]